MQGLPIHGVAHAVIPYSGLFLLVDVFLSLRESSELAFVVCCPTHTGFSITDDGRRTMFV